MPCKRKSFRFSLYALSCAGILLGAVGAQAQTTAPAADTPAAAPAAAPANPLSFNLGVTSDYRYRGILQSHLDPAISGGIDYAAPNGLYVSTWLSSIHWIRDAGGKTRVETDLFGAANSRNSGYLEAAATFNLPWQGWSVTPHAGHQWVHNNGDLSYTDYVLTVTKDLGNGLASSGGVVGTDANKHLYVTPSGTFTGKAELVVGLKYTI